MPEVISVAAYLRVSTEEQREKQTIEAQRIYAEKYAELHGITQLTYFEDDGITGTIPLGDREAGARLLTHAREGLVNTVIVYKIDRLGRTARHILNAVHELESVGVDVKSMTEPFDTSTPAGRFLLNILASVADLERETILERMWHGANRAAANGKWLGGIVPYGYRVNDEKFLEVCEEPLPGLDMTEADVVRMMYRLTTEEHYSCIQIADLFNGMGIPPSYTKDARKLLKGKRKENTQAVWRPGRIRNMIVNSTYMGLHVYGKRASKERETITREVPAIVEPAAWKRAQEILREHMIEAVRHQKRFYLLRGLIRCRSCGRTYQGTAFSSTTKTNIVPYYICGGKSKAGMGSLNRCTAKNVPSAWIESAVWDLCLSFIADPERAIEAMHLADENPTKQDATIITTERTTLHKALGSSEKERERILDLYRRGFITVNDVESQLQKISDEQRVMKDRIAEIDRVISEGVHQKQNVDDLVVLLGELRAVVQAGDVSFEDKFEAIRQLVRGVWVETIGEGDGRWHKRFAVTVDTIIAKVVI